MNVLIKQNIKINSNILNLDYTIKKCNLIIAFINNLEFKTNLLVKIGSLVFIIYYSSIIYLPTKIKYKILQKTPLINKIFNFYRKIILISNYEDELN